MATKIVTKNSSTASAVPTASDLVQGELAVNVADKRLFTEDNAGAIVELGTNPTTLNVNGTATMDGLTVDASSSVIQSATGTASPTPTTFNIATTSSASDWTTTSPWGRLAFYSGDSSGSGGKPHVVLDATASNAIGASSSFSISTTSESSNTLSKRLNINNSGDISFYEDTGTTAKLFWDASAESLGIGTSPLTKLHVQDSAGSPQIRIDNQGTASGIASLLFRSGGSGNPSSIIQSGGTSSGNQGIVFKHGDFGAEVERMRIDSSGNVDLYQGKNLTWRYAAGSTIRGSISVDSADNITFSNTSSNTERMRIDSSGLLKIGTSSTVSPYSLSKFAIDTGTYSFMDLLSTGSSGINFGDAGGAQRGIIEYNHGSDYLRFGTAGSERMRLDSSGKLLVGRTSATFGSDTGIVLRPNNDSYIITDGTTGLTIRRNNSDGDMMQFYRDGSLVGRIGTTGGGLNISTASTGRLQVGGGDVFKWDSNQFYPHVDNARDLGFPTFRWDDIYATNGTIQTSDRNEKQDIAELSDAEQRVAVAAKGLLRKFRWKSSVAEKGDEARTHFGIIAQDLQAAFAAEGLDAGDYAMFISSTWTDEETNEEKTRMGVRYSELLAFIIAAI